MAKIIVELDNKEIDTVLREAARKAGKVEQMGENAVVLVLKEGTQALHGRISLAAVEGIAVTFSGTKKVQS